MLPFAGFDSNVISNLIGCVAELNSRMGVVTVGLPATRCWAPRVPLAPFYSLPFFCPALKSSYLGDPGSFFSFENGI